MFLKPKKHKTFDYTPQFYNPDKDEDIKKRLKFSSYRKKTSPKSSNLIKLLILLAIVLLIYIYISGKL